jgi:maltodextrin utilization protein YvdJ
MNTAQSNFKSMSAIVNKIAIQPVTDEQIAELLAISIEVEELRKEKEKLRKENEQFGKHLTNLLDEYEAVYEFGNNSEESDDLYIDAAEFMKRLTGREHIVEHIEQCRFEAEREERERLAEREYEPDDL